MKSPRHIYGRLGGAHPSRISALSPAAWYRPGVGVTGTLTASNWADQSGNGRDLAQGTAGNQPIYLPYSGTAYGYLPGVAGNYFSTPDSAAASITGDIDIRAYVAMNDWTSGAEQAFCVKYTAANVSYWFGVSTANELRLVTSADGSALIVSVSTVAPTVSDGAALWVRATCDVDNGASGNTVTFYTSSDGNTWTQLGSPVVNAGATSIYNGNAAVEVGASISGGFHCLLGKIYRAQIYDGINGALAVDFNPSTFAETSTNGATAVASTGETWTLNSTGAYPATIVKSPQLLFGGVDEYMKTAAFVLDQPETVYIVFKQVSWTDTDRVFDGDAAASGALYQSATTPKLRITAGSVLDENANLAVGAYGIATVVFDGASSLTQVNAGTAVTGDAGAASMGGFTLASAGTAGTYGNIIVKEVLIFSAAHTAAQRAVVQAYLAARHGIAL